MEYLQHWLPSACGELVVCAGEKTSFIPVIVISPGGNNGLLCLLNGFALAVWGQLFQQRRKCQSISNTLCIIRQSAVYIIYVYNDVTNHICFIIQNVTTEKVRLSAPWTGDVPGQNKSSEYVWHDYINHWHKCVKTYASKNNRASWGKASFHLVRG